MSAEASVVIGIKHIIAGIVGILTPVGVLIGLIWTRNQKQADETSDKLDILKTKVDRNHYTKKEVDDRIRLHIEPMVKELSMNTKTTVELNKTMQEVVKQLAVFGERFGNK